MMTFTKERRKMKKYALAGCSGRAIDMFAKPIEERFSAHACLVGMFDPNHKRMEFYNKHLRTQVPAYASFKKMLGEQKPDCVIVTTVDRYHHEYIIAALNAGIDVITEKPMTVDEKKCRAILAAEKVDRYYRDGCVFSPEVDIEDTMSLNVRYPGGVFLSYSLIAQRAL